MRLPSVLIFTIWYIAMATSYDNDLSITKLSLNCDFFNAYKSPWITFNYIPSIMFFHHSYWVTKRQYPGYTVTQVGRVTSRVILPIEIRCGGYYSQIKLESNHIKSIHVK